MAVGSMRLDSRQAQPIADVTEIAILTAHQHNTICVSKQRRSPSLFPVNRANGAGVDFLGQLHLYLDDMFPTTIGRPLPSTLPQNLSF
jgi:hypothetical protein